MREDSQTDAVCLTADVLYREHAVFVKRFVHKLGILDSRADDVVQDVFIVVHRQGGYRPGPAVPRTWLCAITLRVVANERRRYMRQRRCHTDLDWGRCVHARVQAPAIDHASRLGVAQHLIRALACLTVTQQDVLVRFALDGESCLEIAAALRIPVGTVYSRLHTARAVLREQLEKEDSEDGQSSVCGRVLPST